MSRQLCFDESFIEDCRLSAIPDDILALGHCQDCGHLIPEDELRRGGGYCRDCRAPLEDDDETAKAPAVLTSGVNQLGAGRNRLACRG